METTMQTNVGSLSKATIAILAFGLTCAVSGQPVATARISGTVTTFADKPVPSADVTLVSAFSGTTIAQAKTDADGRFEFTSLKPAVYGLVAKKVNYPCAMSSAINATDGSAIIVPLEMKDWSTCSAAVQFVQKPR